MLPWYDCLRAMNFVRWSWGCGRSSVKYCLASLRAASTASVPGRSYRTLEFRYCGLVWPGVAFIFSGARLV